jgi:hypothetical protein
MLKEHCIIRDVSGMRIKPLVEILASRSLGQAYVQYSLVAMFTGLILLSSP